MDFASLLDGILYSASIDNFLFSVSCLIHAVTSRTSKWLVLRKNYIMHVHTFIYTQNVCVKS